MTEEEWLTTADFSVLQSGLIQSDVSDRKVRLLRVACCKSFWDELTIKAAREAVKAAEQFADEQLSAEQLGQIHFQGFVRFEVFCRVRNMRRANRDAKFRRRISLAAFAIDTASGDVGGLFPILPDNPANPTYIIYSIVEAVAPTLLRDLFGNPFRAVTFDPRWRTSDVVGLAQAMYDDKAFERMPILADALMDAGCEEEQIIAHCRGEGPHVRGCWVVDLVLGKK